MLAVGCQLAENNRPVIQEMVRLGDRDKVSDSLLDVHVDALQSQYRTAFLRDLDVECQHVVHPPFSFEAGGFLPRAECGRKKL